VAAAGSTTLSEAESKRILAAHGVPVVDEQVASDSHGAARAADGLGYPVVVKLCGPSIAHKTERGLVRLNLPDSSAVRAAAEELLAAAGPEDGDVQVLVSRMVRGVRELIAGAHRDPQFGPVVMVGVGGVLAEALADVAFRLVPLSAVDAAEMIEDLRTALLLGPLRGEPPVDRDRLATVLMALSGLMEGDASVQSVDLHPLIVVDGVPVAVDALVEVER
jgi:succinyl-CoA synthetase beta subunit